VASYIAVDLPHAAGGELSKPASAMIQIENCPGGAIVRIGRGCGQSLLHNAIACDLFRLPNWRAINRLQSLQAIAIFVYTATQPTCEKVFQWSLRDRDAVT